MWGRVINILVISGILLEIAWHDRQTMTIKNHSLLALTVAALATYWTMPELTLSSRLLGMVVVSIPMAFLNRVVNEAFGDGDVFLMLIGGFFLGWRNSLLAAFLAILTGGAWACYLMITKRAGKKDHIPFGPFLVLGILAALFWGKEMMAYYISLWRI